jgi:hypothetical protein
VEKKISFCEKKVKEISNREKTNLFGDLNISM